MNYSNHTRKERPWRSKSYPYRGVAGGRRSAKAYGFQLSHFCRHETELHDCNVLLGHHSYATKNLSGGHYRYSYGPYSQIPMLNATPLVNIPSEFVGALVCGVLLAAFMRIAPKNFSLQNVVFPLIITFISTAFSGYTFALIVGSVMNGLPVAAVFATYAVMVVGTASMNCVLVAILTPVLKKALKLV